MRVLAAYTRPMTAAAFFDLDRTLLRRSSALALAGSFREHGVIGRGQLAKAAAWQLLFAARGASAETVRKAAEDGLMVLKGFRVDDLRDLVAGAMEPVLKPLVYQEPLDLVERHRERGEPVYIVSATLQEIVEEIARRARLRRRARLDVRDRGRRLHRPLAPRRARRGEGGRGPRARRASEGFDLAASTAYSDSHTDLPFLEAVGNPVASTPTGSCGGSRDDRGWPMLEFERARLPVARARAPPARCSGSRSCSARAPPSGRPGGVLPERADRRARLLRGGHRDPRRPLPRRRVARQARPRALADRLARDAARPAAGRTPAAPARGARLRALGRQRRARLPDARGDRATAQLAEPPAHARVVVASNCFPTGMLGWYVRRLADGGLVAALTATSPARLSHPRRRRAARRHEPARDRDPELGRRARSSPTSRWARSPTATSCAAPRARRSSSRSAASRRTRRSRSRSGSQLLVDALAGDGYGAVLVVARPEADPVPALRARAAGLRLPGDS